MSLTDTKLLALAASWRTRARAFLHEAHGSRSVRDNSRLAGMASLLEFAARNLCRTTDIDSNEVPPVANANAEADRAQLETEIELARAAGESQP